MNYISLIEELKKSDKEEDKKALEEMKLEIANEIGVETNNKYGSNNTSYENGQLGGRVGGLMSKRLVEMGQQALLKQYNSKK